MCFKCKYNNISGKVEKLVWIDNASIYRYSRIILCYNIIPTDHHLGFQDGGHFEPIFINISVRVYGIEELTL